MSRSLLLAGLSISFLVASESFCWSQQPGIQPRAQPGVAPASVAPAAPQPPKAPFTLSPQEQQRMNQILQAWEQQSNLVKLFKCTFTRWDYDMTFGPKDNDFLMSERFGIIKFRAPDQGTFKEEKMNIYDAAEKKYVESHEELDHWVCDGKSIYQFKPKQKTLEITELPVEMRGKAITEGPLPFIFGAKAKTLNDRYWIRETTPPAEQGKQVWLEAWPKFRQQAQDFSRVEVILGVQDLMPLAMQVYMPNTKDRTAYLFADRKINDKFGDLMNGDFIGPSTPFGWKKVLNPAVPPAAAPPAAQTAPRNPIKQAAAPKTGFFR
jgi:TIGR03009 family protein